MVRCNIVVIARIPVRTDTALKPRVTVCTSAIYRRDAGCILTSSLFAAESLQISMRLHRCVTSRRDFRKVPSDFRTVDLSRIMHRSFVGHRAYADTGNDDQSASTTLNRGRVCAVVQLCFMTHKQGVQKPFYSLRHEPVSQIMSEGLKSIPLRLPLLCCLPRIWRHHHTTGTHLACLTSADILAALAISGERAMHGAMDFTPWIMTRQDEMQSTEVHPEMKSACPQLAPQLCMLEKNLPHIQPERLI